MTKEALYLTLARFRCHWGNKKIGFFRKKCHFSFYCLNGNKNASTASSSYPSRMFLMVWRLIYWGAGLKRLWFQNQYEKDVLLNWLRKIRPCCSGICIHHKPETSISLHFPENYHHNSLIIKQILNNSLIILELQWLYFQRHHTHTFHPDLFSFLGQEILEGQKRQFQSHK